MPPKRDSKRVTIAPGIKGQSGANTTGNKKKLKDPIQRQGKNIRTRDLKRTRSEYQQQAEDVRAERDRDIRELRAKIEFLKRDSEKIVKSQQLKFGTTLDELKTLQRDLDQAKAINDALLKEVEGKRMESDRLQSDMDEIMFKINDVMLEASDLNREKKIHEANKRKIDRMEEKCQLLIKHNRDLRSLLLKHHLDPTANAEGILTPPPVNSPVPIKKRESSLPMIYNKKNLVREIRSLEDLTKRDLHRKGHNLGFRRASLPVQVKENVYHMPNYKSVSPILPRLKPQAIHVTV